MTDLLLQEFDFTTLQKQMDLLYPSNGINVFNMVVQVIQGKQGLSLSYIYEIAVTAIVNEVGNLKLVFLSILLIGILSALFHNIAKMFQNHQIANMGYYLIYLYLIMILLRTFYESYTTCKEAMEYIVTFIQIGIPLFTASLAMTGKIMTSSVFYQIALLVIFLIEMVLLHIVIPYIYAYVLLSIVNGLTQENRFDSILRLLRKSIEWLLKVMLGIVAGINLIQSMVTPVIDGVNKGVIQKVATLIPGVGTVTDSVIDLVLGSTILIKNSIGVVYSILFILVCLKPFIELLCITVLLRVSAAVIGMVCDPRMVRCVEEVSIGSGLLLRTLLSALSMFLITVAIITVATSAVSL
ncbi:MAG: stage III sporulation protein AE [Eubacteriales bacterium]